MSGRGALLRRALGELLAPSTLRHERPRLPGSTSAGCIRDVDLVNEPSKSRSQRPAAVIGGMGAVAFIAVSRQFEGPDRGLFMAAAIGATLLFIIVAATVATRRDSKK